MDLSVCEDAGVPSLRRTGAVGLALTAYDVWQRLSPRQRKTLLALAKRHGPRIAARALRAAAARRRF
jgi:hypothetical protein